jgi:hypothetical protein
MRPTITRDATHNFQAPENWDAEKDGECGDLLVRAELYGESKIIQLVSAWKPSASELALLNAGGVVEVMLCVPNQPVMAVAVVEAAEPAAVIVDNREPITINEGAHGHG